MPFSFITLRFHHDEAILDLLHMLLRVYARDEWDPKLSVGKPLG